MKYKVSEALKWCFQRHYYSQKHFKPLENVFGYFSINVTFDKESSLLLFIMHTVICIKHNSPNFKDSLLAKVWRRLRLFWILIDDFLLWTWTSISLLLVVLVWSRYEKTKMHEIIIRYRLDEKNQNKPILNYFDNFN